MTPGQSIPGQSTPGQSTPGQSTPGQPVPGQPVPGQSIPGQSIPPQDPKSNVQTSMQAPNNGQQEGQNSDAQVKAANVAQNTETITEVVNIVAETLAEPEKLEALSTQEVEQIFEELTVNDLTPEQADELVETLVKAPKKVKKAFEAKVNIFSGEVDDYVPTNQSIPVSERRTLIAVGNTLGAAGMFIRRRED
ncbi:MAG: hypothetical protein F2884_00945 [Actinobacteria bacterium]|uniref:Unannotated protein n=1 Tax=freshwater metagenome TaxID=449393 RepID=A0A6J7N8C0_9ZZZZ|nr:hypothetical protein [Actinomycetota bacterium]